MKLLSFKIKIKNIKRNMKISKLQDNQMIIQINNNKVEYHHIMFLNYKQK